MSARADVGETLIEVLLTVVIVGLTFTALFTSLASAGKAGNSQRASVEADVVMRNYAETIKEAAQTCVALGKYVVDYAPPTGFTVSMRVVGTVGVAGVVAAGSCPPVAVPQVLTLEVGRPPASPLTMEIRVGTP